MSHSRATWETFTLVDCFALVTAAAIGVYQAVSNFLISQPETSAFPKTALIFGVFLNAFRLAGMYAGPLVIGGHLVFQKRRQCLYAGEWLWLAPLIMVGLVETVYGLFMGTRSIRIEPLSTYYMVVGAAVELALVALFVLCAMAYRVIKWKRPLRWTEWLGCAVCIVNGAFYMYCVVVFPILI